MRLIIFPLPSVFHTRPGHERARRSLAGGVLGWVLTPPGKCPGWPGRAPGPGRVCLLGHPARPGPGASPGAPCPVRAPAHRPRPSLFFCSAPLLATPAGSAHACACSGWRPPVHAAMAAQTHADANHYMTHAPGDSARIIVQLSFW